MQVAGLGALKFPLMPQPRGGAGWSTLTRDHSLKVNLHISRQSHELSPAMYHTLMPRCQPGTDPQLRTWAAKDAVTDDPKSPEGTHLGSAGR